MNAAPSTTGPATIAHGRYELKTLLGEGGKKRVYLARDCLLERDVAVALIKTEGLDAGARERVMREAQAMGKLGAHPHVVTIFDLGDERGQLYLVTELMAGGDIEGLIESAPDRRVPEQHAVALAMGICRGLAFAHEQGLVHRDLKPGNVWLTAEGEPKIGDFGLALPLERSRLTQEGTIVGTVAYMPPEQALGGEVTPRADLYSLGALLYEMLTGRPPFVGDDPISVISQHINTPPVAPSWHVAECPRPLEALVLRLLAKDPSERPHSADNVLRALEAIDLGGSVDSSTEQASTVPMDGLAAGTFVGRRRELGELKAALEGSLSGSGRMVTLLGEPGIGKSRTALELATHARLRGAQVFWGRCYEGEGAPPYWPWVQAIRDYIREVDLDQLRSELGSGAAEIAEVVADLRQRLPDLGAPTKFDDLQQARFRLFDSLSAFLRRASRSRPIVLVLDDLHWADEGSLRLLEFVARELADTRVLVVGTYRDIELSRQHPLARALAELTRERLFDRVILRGLSRDDVGAFIEVTCGITPPGELVDVVYAHTEGNPLFVVEIVRLLVQEGELTPERLARRESWSVGIPEGVKEVIGRRLERLSERCNETLAIASVIGREFGLDQLGSLIDDLSEARLLDVLDEALGARIVEELPRHAGRYQFTHSLIQETLASELSLTRRVRLHARIAETLEVLYAAELDAHASELARHFGEAETVLGSQKLVRYSMLAGEQALAANAPLQALAHFERAAAAAGDHETDSESAALLFGLARAQVAALERYEIMPAIGNLVRAFELFLDLGDVGRAVAVAAHPLPLSLGLGATPYRELISRALTLVPPDSAESGRLLSQHGWLRGIVDGDHDAADRAFREALTIAERTHDAALERRTRPTAAFVDAFHLRWEGCARQSRLAIELAEAAGDLPNELQARRTAAWAATATGERERARTDLDAALAHADRLHERWWIASASYDAGLLALYEGYWDRASELIELGLATQPRDPRHLSHRALLEHAVGDARASSLYLEQLRELASRAPPPGPIADHVFYAVAVAVVGRGLADDSGLDIATSTAEVVLALPGLAPVLAALCRRALALIAVQRSDADRAARLYPEIEPDRGTAGIFCPLTVDRVLGLLAATLERVDLAQEHFEEGLAFCERAGYRPEYAWTASDYAETLLARGAAGDRERAVTLADVALATARDLGMRPLMERVLAHRDILKA